MIKREDAAKLFEVYERSLRVLTEAEPVLFSLPKDDDRDALVSAHTRVITDILSRLRAPLVLQYRDLDTHVPTGPHDTLLDQSEQQCVDRLTSEQVRQIDDALVSECASSWRKVARVVGAAMTQLSESLPEVSDGYYAQRVALLVQARRIESQGNLNYMRYSEVRLVGRDTSAKD